ncbi:hypothetical protein L323_13650 [Ruminiclostridium papyrosolvens C7]|uniref:Uncharacterized protein n=1 Tax=Ruminiclostridium papyrosolvens C7 TaxID=1330534 RepID=U4R1L4_9FIRM|nr:hypothetical protein L323_13650 [Ruminiclostridium papyrosolvens C7]
MDFLMIGILAVCFISTKLFTDWCGCQIEKS